MTQLGNKGQPFLSIQNIVKKFGDHAAVNNVSIDIEKGEIFALLGSSGCGKSTILKLLTGVLTPSDGSIRADGNEIHGITGHFAYMPQNDLLFPWKTILDNVCLYGEIHGSLARAREEALKNFPAFGLTGYENSYPSALSGGMRQRAAFLLTALCQADILLLDEPFGALDVITRSEMQDWLLAMRARLNRTVLLVTHDMDEAIYLSDRILILNPAPAGIVSEIRIDEKKRDRNWLYEQGELRKTISQKIKGF